MRFMVLLKGTRMFDAPPALMEGIMKLGAEATAAGALLDTAGLAPSVAGARVQLAGGELTVVDGPYTESKELISYAVYQVPGKEEAVEWASRFLRLHRELAPGWEGEAEILKVFGPEDFAPPVRSDAPDRTSAAAPAEE
jgi:hypothetical protein